ncbi:MAG: PTS sugar transporter subunit IIA [Bdellovibrionota bacterium]
MVGVLIVTHGRVGEILLEQAQLIAGELHAIETVSVRPEDTAEQMREGIRAATQRLDTGRGVLILTDMFGGTPSNVALSFLDSDGRLEVLSGINLPMLLKLVTARSEETSLSDVAAELKAAGRKNIYLAREILGVPARIPKAKAQ